MLKRSECIQTISCDIRGYVEMSVFEERLRGRLVRAARLWCRMSPLGREFEAGLCHAATGKLSLCQPSSKWIAFFRIREG